MSHYTSKHLGEQNIEDGNPQVLMKKLKQGKTERHFENVQTDKAYPNKPFPKMLKTNSGNHLISLH